MWSTARDVAAGDMVIIWLTRDFIQPLIVTPGKDFNSKFGNYRHSDFVGVPYGSQVPSRTGRGFIHVLRPTPELWTLALPHRTQILYLADIAFITSFLNIKRGSQVIEAGTGSGSFSHSIARTIGLSGHLWSYEFHEQRARKAKEEFARHGMDQIVTLTHRNVCKDGFTLVDTADAVFLDLPAPWEAVDHAKQALRKDCVTRICCFSPCMEQVLRTVSALNEAGFADITMYETLLRPYEVSQVPTLQPISEITDKLQKSEQKREEKRQRQIAANSAQLADMTKKRKNDDKNGDNDDGTSEAQTISIKRVRMDKGEEDTTMEDIQLAPALVVKLEDVDMDESASETRMSVSKVFSEVRGHTSYLTFACLIPSVMTSPSDNNKNSVSAPPPITPVAREAES